jgi:hypothetical protein
VNLPHDTVVNAATPLLHVRSDEAREHLHVRDLGRAKNDNSVVGKIAFIVEGARISKVAGRAQLGQET